MPCPFSIRRAGYSQRPDVPGCLNSPRRLLQPETDHHHRRPVRQQDRPCDHRIRRRQRLLRWRNPVVLRAASNGVRPSAQSNGLSKASRKPFHAMTPPAPSSLRPDPAGVGRPGTPGGRSGANDANGAAGRPGRPRSGQGAALETQKYQSAFVSHLMQTVTEASLDMSVDGRRALSEWHHRRH